MKILHFSWDTVVPGIGGGKIHEWNTAKAFTKLGHKVRLISEWEYDKKVEEKLEGVSIKRVHWRVPFLKILVLFIKGIMNSFYHIKDFKPDVIYERYRIFGGYGVIIGKLFFNKTTILEVNDPTIDAPYIENRINKFTKNLATLWERLVFHCCDKIIASDEVCVKRANPKKVKITSWAVDVEKFNPKEYERTKWKDKFVCLFIGTFAEWQGVHTILETAKKMDKKDVLFVFAGEDREDKENVKFLGRVDYDKIPQLIMNSDVCLYTPDTEDYEPMKRLGFYFSPLKIFEYMSMKKPVIVSDAGNLKKIIKNGKNGYRIEVNNTSELKKKIMKLYNNKTLREEIGERNRRECEKKYNWVSIIKEVLNG